VELEGSVSTSVTGTLEEDTELVELVGWEDEELADD